MAERADKSFEEYFSDPASDVNVSDAELEALMSGAGKAARPEIDPESLAPGARIEGTVLGARAEDLLVELDAKSHGAIPLAEFEGGRVPAAGSRIESEFRRYDAERGVYVLTVLEVRTELAWSEIQRGDIVDAVVTATNKGGLTLRVKQMPAFLPIGQLERGRVADASSYVGKTLRCEVTSVNRAAREIVLSRRRILEREEEKERHDAIARLQPGETRPGRVVRINEHGAFIDIGAVEGLLHASKLHRRMKEQRGTPPLRPGDTLSVRIAHVDRDACRVGLDLLPASADPWSGAAESYSVGETITGVVSRTTPDGVLITLEEGIEGWIPAAHLATGLAPPVRGALIRATITAVDPARHRIELRPSE